MNEVINTINERVSLRRYKDKMIDKEHLDLIINSAIKAPTAGNMMMYSIIKITNKNTKELLSKTCDNQPFIKNAQVILLFLADMRKWFDYFNICDVKDIKSPGINDFMLGVNDAIIACQNAVLTAESLGIGSCYIGDIMENYEKHKEILDLPSYTFPACMITLGYYPDNFKKIYTDRFEKEYVVFEEKYQRLNEDNLKQMYKHKEEKMLKNNQNNAKNFGELIYKRKISSEFSIEMNRSIKEWIKDFTGYCNKK